MIRKIIAFILILCIIPIYQATAVYDRETAADEIWNCLIEETQSEIISAGIMGYFWRESTYRSDAIPHWYYAREDVCEPFTEYLYKLDREDFIKEIQSVGGYGLGQWYSVFHLWNFYDWCKVCEYDYDDLIGQCKFTVWEMKLDKEFWEKLESLHDPYQVGLIIGAIYDGASEQGVHTIASKAQMIYNERVLK